MDRETLGALSMGRYDVRVEITAFDEQRTIEWLLDGDQRRCTASTIAWRSQP